MKVEARIFELLTIFLLRHRDALPRSSSQEPAGSAALFLTGGLSLIVGTYFRFVARRLEAPRPEDNPAGEVSDGAGDVGFFSPGSYWPIILAGSVALMAISLAFMYFWAIAISAIILLICVAGCSSSTTSARPTTDPTASSGHEAHGELAVGLVVQPHRHASCRSATHPVVPSHGELWCRTCCAGCEGSARCVTG